MDTSKTLIVPGLKLDSLWGWSWQELPLNMRDRPSSYLLLSLTQHVPLNPLVDKPKNRKSTASSYWTIGKTRPDPTTTRLWAPLSRLADPIDLILLLFPRRSIPNTSTKELTCISRHLPICRRWKVPVCLTCGQSLTLSRLVPLYLRKRSVAMGFVHENTR